MASTRLKGQNGEYVYNPESEKTRIISRGKFSIIFRGYSYSDKMPVIIKMLSPEIAKHSENLMRFKLEAGLRFTHPNIVRCLDYIKHNDNYFIILENINGIDLKRLKTDTKTKRKIPPVFWIKAAIGILDALDEMHKRDVYHRDIKPSNIMVTYTKEGIINFDAPEIKLIDLGLSKVKNITIKTKKRKKNEFPLLYSSPEQLLGFDSLINASSDIYSLGVSLYELFTGKPPYYDMIPAKVIALQISHELPDNPKIPKILFPVLKKATSKYRFPKPPNRYSSLVLRDLLLRGQKKRFENAKRFKAALLEIMPYIDKEINEKNNFLKYLNNLFKGG